MKKAKDFDLASKVLTFQSNQAGCKETVDGTLCDQGIHWLHRKMDLSLLNSTPEGICWLSQEIMHRNYQLVVILFDLTLNEPKPRINPLALCPSFKSLVWHTARSCGFSWACVTNFQNICISILRRYVAQI